MKHISALILLSFFTHSFLHAQYWQQKADFVIDVTLNDKEHSVDGFEKITYTNNSPDTLQYIWFHIWPNAYKNDRTAFSDQLLQNGNTKFYFSNKEQRGYINRLDFKVDGITAKTEDHPQHIDILKILLPVPLLPGRQTIISTPFHVQLPYIFSRSGYSNGQYQVTQWYPKPAVYDCKGWHPIPYLDQGEFYSEFGNYDVRITAPESFVIAATGQLQNEEEKQWLHNRSNYLSPKTILKKQPATNTKGKAKTTTSKKSTPVKKQVQQPTTAKIEKTKTLQFKQENIHDFAWFANRNFIVNTDTCILPSGKVIEVATFYTAKNKNTWSKTVSYAKDALRTRSSWIGDYPYSNISVVEGAGDFQGGMEYPTITNVSPMDSAMLDQTIAHEIGHNWFYGALATNEREHTWLDEGLNTFYDNRYQSLKNKNNTSGKNTKAGLEKFEKLLFQTFAVTNNDQPIETPATDFTNINYSLIAYYKTAAWLKEIEAEVGTAAFDKAMQAYYKQWQFKHPYPKDFQNAFEHLTGEDLTQNFQLLQQKGFLKSDTTFSKWKVASLFSKNSIINYVNQPSKNLLFISPAVGYNLYDKFMIGAFVSNYKLPPNRLQFYAAPVLATGSKSLNGLGHISYSSYPDNTFKKIEGGLFASSFSTNMTKDSNGKKVFERFYKVVPSLRFTFNHPLQSKKGQWLEWKTYFIGEKDFSSFAIKSTDSLNYVDSTEWSNNYINQLTFGTENYRALYPYNYKLQIQQGKGFYRINAIAEYFFNYAKGGGANIRFFASKFGYLGNHKNSFATFRYQPKLLGVTGEEDYTYSNYFLGRTASFANESSIVKNGGIAAQQIMIRDGGLKLRLDQYDFLQGRSDDWVAAINLNTTLPEKLFPFKIPLKLFLDLGTYAPAWEKDAQLSRFLYVGGLQLSLFQNVVNVYAPIVYSSEFRDNLKTSPEQNKFFKKITFSIDFSQLSLKKLTGNKLPL